MSESEKKDRWDVFISHASEDKEAFVQPLAEALDRFGVKVWYDRFSLKIGDSLSRSVDRGLASASFGLVVLSPAFFSKRWPEYELRGLTARELAGQQAIVPIWHNCHRAVQMQPVGGELGQPGWMIVESVTVGKRA